MILGEDGAIKYIKKNLSTDKSIDDARKYTKELKAIVDGKDYEEELVKIDHLESDKKILSRKKYAFSIKDLSERVLRNTDNVWTATGGSKLYDIDNEQKRKELSKWASNVRGGKSIEQWNECYWMTLYHTDPAGITFLEYDTDLGVDPYPTYKSINSIRNYIANGVSLEVLLFEPIKSKNESGEVFKKWRLVDDEKDYMFAQKGNDIILIEDETHDNPFGEVPALINSDLIDIDTGKRLSPLDSVVELLKEYMRDKSIKTIFKFLQGFPLFWRYVTYCEDCSGTGKSPEGGTCNSCDGHGIVGRRDVTDSVDLPIPTSDESVLAPNIAGWVVPPLDIWERYDQELELLEKAVKFTHWGALIDNDIVETATGRMIDAQPIIQRLHKYSSPAEYREKKITDWGANFLDPTKNKDESIANIYYGRDYAIIPAKTILEIYQVSKEKGDNATILDNLFHQYLLSRYKSDPTSLNLAVLKSNVEPYLHYTAEEVRSLRGEKESQKKVLFSDWWKSVITVNKTVDILKEEFESWFDSQYLEVQNKKEDGEQEQG